MMKGKRLLSALLAAVMLGALVGAFPSPALAENALTTGTANTDKLNIRSGPGLNKSIVTTIDRGTEMNIYAVEGEWLRVDIPSEGKSGYARGKYVLVNAPSIPFYGLGSTTGKVHLRAKANTNSDSRATLAANTGLSILSIADNGWYNVRVHATGKEGYVSNRYVKVVCKAVQGSAGQQAVITGSGVNLRSGAGTGYESLAKLAKNTAVTVLGVDGTWSQVKVTATGKTGYVSSSYVRLGAAGAEEIKGNAVISSSGVHFRTGPGTGYSSLGKLSKGTAVTVKGTSGSWYQLTVNSTGKTGYVYKTFVRVSTATPTPAPAKGNAVINGVGVHYRTGPGTGYSSLGKLSKGTAVTVKGTSGSWYQVQVSSTGKTGYVYNTYVKFTTATPTPVPTNKVTANGFINGAGVNFRAGAGTRYQSLGRLVKNTQVAVLGAAGDWYYIQVVNTGKTGYVYKTYVTLLGAVITPTPTPTAKQTPVPTATPTPAPTKTPVVTAPPTLTTLPAGTAAP